MIDVVSQGKVDIMKMVSDIVSMDRADEAFKALTHNDGTLAKILIEIG